MAMAFPRIPNKRLPIIEKRAMAGKWVGASTWDFRTLMAMAFPRIPNKRLPIIAKLAMAGK
jgi:hypothetical protein